MRTFPFHPGLFADIFREFSRPLCFIHTDADVDHAAIHVIVVVRRLVPGGCVVFDDGGNGAFPKVKLAIERHLDPVADEVAPSLASIQCFAIKR